MSDAMIIEIGRQTLLTMILLSGPMLLLSLVVGLGISIFQAATHLSESTLTFIPKLVAMGAALMFFLPWMLQIFRGYFHDLLQHIPQLLRG